MVGCEEGGCRGEDCGEEGGEGVGGGEGEGVERVDYEEGSWYGNLDFLGLGFGWCGGTYVCLVRWWLRFLFGGLRHLFAEL